MIALTAPMIHTFSALMLAHVFADFLLQSNWMIRNKRNGFVLLLHGGIVFVATAIALGGVWQVALPVAAAHLLIDIAKVSLPPRIRDTLSVFLIDQAAHIATLCAVTLYWPNAFSLGMLATWADFFTTGALMVSGAIICVQAGGFAVGLLTRRFQSAAQLDGLPDAGRLIGQLERALILLLVLIGQPAGIGFLIAAKSILRFDAAASGQKAGEYVIIGTLASFTWALASAYATVALLEIVAATP